MPRKYRLAKSRATVWPPSWWMQQDLWGGPIQLGTESDEEAYKRHARRGFETVEEMRNYWEENRVRLMAEYGGDVVFGWWAYRKWG